MNLYEAESYLSAQNAIREIISLPRGLKQNRFMATRQGTVDYILDQLTALRGVSARKMFSEYALYYDDKVVGLVCDDKLYIKRTDKGKKFVGKYYQEGNAYRGAKISMVIDEDRIDDREWLSELIQITAQYLPLPKKQKMKLK